MGSVKDLQIVTPATADQPGIGRFIFSDRYSVFDWGEMPDHIPHKGEAIALLGAYFFEKLEAMGIPTHYRGVVENGTAVRLAKCTKPVHELEVTLLNVIKPARTGDLYDYAAYRTTAGGFLIPLEVIYRNALPAGSSVFKRLKEGQTTLEELGLTEEPRPNDIMATPILDVSTKLEITDRYMSWDEAQNIAGLSAAELAQLKELTLTINRLITQEFTRIGLTNEDGKIEVGFDRNRRIMLVDVLGTLDECRFTRLGLPVSKEIARIYYRGSPWYTAVEEAKKKDRQNWKTICRVAPEPLPARLRELISQIYCACTNEITGKTWFRNIPPLERLLSAIKEFLPS